MAEVTFAKQFLAQLDARPVKISSDWVADARRLPAQAPFTLPKPETPFPSPAGSSRAANQDASQASAASDITVILKPLRGTPTTLTKISPVATSIYDLKTRCAKQTGYAPDKIKILWERKPVPDAKVLAEVVGQASQDTVELGVMFVGQPTQAVRADDQPSKPAEAPVAQGPSGTQVIQSPGFWRDLEGFVLQRVRDEKVSRDAVELWKKASLSGHGT